MHTVGVLEWLRCLCSQLTLTHCTKYKILRTGYRYIINAIGIYLLNDSRLCPRSHHARRNERCKDCTSTTYVWLREVLNVVPSTVVLIRKQDWNKHAHDQGRLVEYNKQRLCHYRLMTQWPKYVCRKFGLSSIRVPYPLATRIQILFKSSKTLLR